MIIDYEMYNKFLDILPELERDEVYFISLSARNKYLTKEERLEYSLGRTEMFSREIAQSKEELTHIIKNVLPAKLSYKTTNNGKLMPEKALVVYININPSSMIKAYQYFQKKMNKEVYEIFFAQVHEKESNYQGVLRAKRFLMNEVQKATSRRYFIDIDYDLQNDKYVNLFSGKLLQAGVKFSIIETQGGYHFLIIKDSLKNIGNFRLHELVKKHDIIAKELNGEVIFNNNQMVPIPGCLQAGKLVRII